MRVVRGDPARARARGRAHKHGVRVARHGRLRCERPVTDAARAGTSRRRSARLRGSLEEAAERRRPMLPRASRERTKPRRSPALPRASRRSSFSHISNLATGRSLPTSRGLLRSITVKTQVCPTLDPCFKLTVKLPVYRRMPSSHSSTLLVRASFASPLDFTATQMSRGTRPLSPSPRSGAAPEISRPESSTTTTAGPICSLAALPTAPVEPYSGRLDGVSS
mmetsp:Transcript_113058/g.314381  ORF Transcript_113058/g.314381 Transcript_113058/m.314381 type:complete len:222 (+) Transcript_113058:87-752(+)